jgi:hypothetical protein
MRGDATKVVVGPARGNTLEGKSPGELRARIDLNRRFAVADSRTEQGPEGEGALKVGPIWEPSNPLWCLGIRSADVGCRGGLRSVSNVKRAAALETANGCARGAKLWRANPKSGSGMKQGQQARGG